jgi:CubicO group peptidase (beta-lactamase class C family)
MSDPTTALTERLDPFVVQLMELQRTPGLAVAVVRGGGVVYARGFGAASLADRRPVTPETLFHMASVTKPFVATAIMQLVESGRVDLDAPVAGYIPHFALADARAARITVRQMLSHTGGMPDDEEFGWDRPEYDEGALERYVRGLRERALDGEPGERFRYSNVAYEVLGDLIAKVSGMTFEAYVDDHILDPLGMTRSTLLVREAAADLLAAPHVVNVDGQIVVSDIFPYNRAHAPSSTLYANVVEMSRWALANLNGGALDGRRILRPETLAAMWEPVAPARAGAYQPGHVGLSWFRVAYRGQRVIYHTGGDTGFESTIVLLPEAGLGVVAMCNTDAVYDVPDLVANAVLEIALGG